MYWIFPLLLMVSISVLNDLCTSIKPLLSKFKQVFPSEFFDNSFDLNNITSASAVFIFTQLETHDCKIDKISCFWPTILTTATLLISGSLLESTSGIFAEGGHSFLFFQRKLGPLNHWSILCLFLAAMRRPGDVPWRSPKRPNVRDLQGTSKWII